MNIFKKIKAFFCDLFDSLSILREESERGGIDGTDTWNGGEEHK